MDSSPWNRALAVRKSAAPSESRVLHPKRIPNGVKFFIHQISKRFLSHTPPFSPPGLAGTAGTGGTIFTAHTWKLGRDNACPSVNL